MVAVAVRPERLPLGKVAVVDEDEVLVARLAAGDDDAMGELFDRYGPFVLGLARRVSRSTQVAEDVAQDVLTALWSDPSRFDPNRGSLRAFLGVQAYRRAVDAMRRDSRRRAREEHVVLPELGCASMDGRDAIEAATLAEVVFWKGLTCREVARVLAIPEGTAKSRLRLAQSKLSEWLAPLSGEPV
jgi:RNA polymerase sigma-70 factor (ECF subfamily)